MQKTQRRMLKFIAIAFIGAALLSVFHTKLSFLTDFTGIGRPVDFFIYCCSAVLVRELFLSRARDLESRQKITELVRNLAIKDAIKLSTNETSSNQSSLANK